MPAASWLMNLGFAGSAATIVATIVAGPEYTVPESRLHCTVPEDTRLHSVIPPSKLHYTVPNKDDN